MQEANGEGPGRPAPVPGAPQHPSWSSPVPLQPPDPPNEEERLKALRCLGVLDSKRDPQLDFVTEVATEAFQVVVLVYPLQLVALRGMLPASDAMSSQPLFQPVSQAAICSRA